MTIDFLQAELVFAQEHANYGRNEEFIELSNRIVSNHSSNQSVLLQVAKLQLHYGFPSYARNTLNQLLVISPENKAALISLAHAELQLGNLVMFQEIYDQLFNRFPEDLQILSPYIHFSDYIQGQETLQFNIAEKWGKCAIQLAAGYKSRPSFRVSGDKKIRIGYVSADFCQHTVGILFKEIIKYHDTKVFSIFSFSSGNIRDHITEQIAKNSHFIDVSKLSDRDLVKLILQEQIDILVDLSGHTAGSRLSAFSYRPAPIQVSMLGYYASTGLPYIDACILDNWHAHENVQSYFIEPIKKLPTTRLCYTPAFTPPLAIEPPAIKNGFITFGSFNNTLKYNQRLFAVWSEILHSVSNSKLLLKWRTFNDPLFKQYVTRQFCANGIDPKRLILRGPSFHEQMLHQYRDVDIGLDPFPFSGGVTSCEALFMGVPVITLPQSRVPSRQTYAFLSSIGHLELVANSETDYIQKAETLSRNIELISIYRNKLREEMLLSSLMNISEYTRLLEKCLIELFNDIKKEETKT